MRVCANLPLAGRDVRLDLFRGLANWAIFLDHIPHEVLSWITIKNYGFSDAADLFVFISGYTAAFVFGRVMIERGYAAAASRLAKRAFTLYAAHIIVVVIYIAVIACVSRQFHDPDDLNQFNVAVFMNMPFREFIQALALRYKPVNLDVLPLYILLLGAFAPALWLWFANRIGYWLVRWSCMLPRGILAGIFRPLRRAFGILIRSPGSCCFSSAPGSPWAAAIPFNRSFEPGRHSGWRSPTSSLPWW
jgi:hypothetical protein